MITLAVACSDGRSTPVVAAPPIEAPRAPRPTGHPAITGHVPTPDPRAVAGSDGLERARSSGARGNTVRISAAGDLVLNPHAMRTLASDGAYDRLLAGYASSVREDEIALLNLEQPLVDDLVPLDPGWPRQNPARPRRSPILGATPPLAGALARAGVDLVTLANNHAYDQGRAGLART